jgi:hypothetical protein
MMQRAILKIQWKASWHLVLVLAVAAFALPIVSVRLGWHGDDANLPLFLTELQLWGFFYPLLAIVSAIVIAVAVWLADRRTQHGYSLLLPIPRWRYVLLRYVAGLALLLPIILALWLGTLIAVQGISLPPGIQVYSTALTLKFALALLVLFGICFAFGSASARTVGIAIRVLGLLLAVHVAVILLVPTTNLLWMAVKALAVFPGPLAPLGGRWMLIDA